MKQGRDELYHHGVKGMKWGQRKAVDDTSAGVDFRRAKKLELKNAKRDFKKAKRDLRDATDASDIVDTLLNDYDSELSNTGRADLWDARERINKEVSDAESKYSSMRAKFKAAKQAYHNIPEVKQARKKRNIAVGGAVVATVLAGIGTYLVRNVM